MKNSKKLILALIIITFLAAGYITYSHIKQNECDTLFLRDQKLLTNSEYFSAEHTQIKQKLTQCHKDRRESNILTEKAFLHDLKCKKAIKNFLKTHKHERIVGILGRASIQRDSAQYREVAYVAKKLSENNYTIATGGGSGTMEAAHLGAWFAGRPASDLESALLILKQAPSRHDKDYLKKALEVKNKYLPLSPVKGIAVRSFSYSHESTNIFSEYYITFYFNSLRQDAILRLSKNGSIFFEGGFGTFLELFLALESNHENHALALDRPLILFDSIKWKNSISKKILHDTYRVNSVDEVFKFLHK